MEKIVAEIKNKPELRDLPNTLVEGVLNEYLAKNKMHIPSSPKGIKLVIKEVRAELRRYAGQYSKSNAEKRMDLLKENKINELLHHHASTKERIHDYDEIRKIIGNFHPKSILDLGSGINPIAIAKKGIRYHAYDIKDTDLHLVEAFFKKEGIEGDVHHADITAIGVFPKVDLCIIFKVLDILDNKIKISRKLLSIIEAKHFIVSFATRTLSGRPMNRPYRRWFESILKDMGYTYEVKRMSHEILYIIKKN